MSTTQPPGLRLNVRFFDGKSTQAHEAQVWVDGGLLQVQGSDVSHTCQVAQVTWPERTRHGPRLALLPGGGSIQSEDFSAWDAWSRTTLKPESITVHWQQSWRATVLCMTALIALMVASYIWGLPWLSLQVARHLPAKVEAQISDAVLAHINHLMAPSKLPLKDQAAIEQAWREALQRHTTLQQAKSIKVRPTRLFIRHGDIGPNALALPGGAIILTDDMVKLVRNDHSVIVGVLAHELGHVQHQHGMQMLVQVGVMGLAASLLWGDYSGVLAAVPLWLGQAHYSRKAEQAADAYSVTVLRDIDVSPQVMVTLFERVKLYRQCCKAALEWPPEKDSSAQPLCKPSNKPIDAVKEGLWGLGFASHPPDDSRIKFFNDAAPKP